MATQTRTIPGVQITVDTSQESTDLEFTVDAPPDPLNPTPVASRVRANLVMYSAPPNAGGVRVDDNNAGLQALVAGISGFNGTYAQFLANLQAIVTALRVGKGYPA